MGLLDIVANVVEDDLADTLFSARIDSYPIPTHVPPPTSYYTPFLVLFLVHASIFQWMLRSAVV